MRGEVPLRNVAFLDRAIIPVSPDLSPVFVNSTQRFPGSRYYLLDKEGIWSAHQRSISDSQTDKLLLCGESLDCRKFEIIFENGESLLSSDFAEPTCVRLGDSQGSHPDPGDARNDLTCIGVRFHLPSDFEAKGKSAFADSELWKDLPSTPKCLTIREHDADSRDLDLLADFFQPIPFHLPAFGGTRVGTTNAENELICIDVQFNATSGFDGSRKSFLADSDFWNVSAGIEPTELSDENVPASRSLSSRSG
jgi:hypothetical protein